MDKIASAANSEIFPSDEEQDTITKSKMTDKVKTMVFRSEYKIVNYY